MSNPRALIFGLLMIGISINVESQRAPNKWWNELKSYRNVHDSELSDDQLLTEASRQSSNLVRIPAPSIISEKHVQFDDQPYDSLSSESKFMRRSTVFDSQDNSHDRIWSYFDSKLKNRDEQQSNSVGTSGSLFSSFERHQNPSLSSSSFQDDDFFSRHFKRNINNPDQDSRSKNDKTFISRANTNGAISKDRVLALDFGKTRRKNPEEKERWNQLIKSIFDSSPRANADTNQYGSNKDYDYKSMTKTKIVEPSDIEDGVITEKTMKFESNEDVLKNELEENINMKDMQISSNDEGGISKTATTISSMIQNETEDETEEIAVNNDEVNNNKEENKNETDSRKRHVTDAPTPMEQEEEEEGEEERDNDETLNTVDNDEDNQYLRPQNKSKLARPPPSTTIATTPATVNLNTKTPTRRQPQILPSSDSFGSRIHRSNETYPKKPSFTMHFEIGKKKIEERMINELKKDIMFHSVDPTAPTTTPRSSTEIFDGVSREMIEEMNNSFDLTTPLPMTTTLRPFKSRKSASGKWIDSETFKLNEDRSMIMDPNEDEDEGEIVTVRSVMLNKHASRVPSSTLTTRLPQVVQKRKLQTQVRRKAVMANIRPVRQNTEFVEEDSLDKLERLSKALPGTPGQDYPIFDAIPRTSFDCAAHEWPGYYADVDTQCQVFHICQRGGRHDSFLCPNGTVFNQQLFICDWWHNVKCQEVTQHYALNQQIYDYSWESKRTNMGASTTPNKSQKVRLAKRMGIADVPTTIAPITHVSTESTNAEQVWRRAQHLQSGTKGRSRFGRGVISGPLNNERNAIKEFFERYKYAQSTTEVPTTITAASAASAATAATKITTNKNVVKKIAASGSAPILTFTTIHDNAIRHPKHHRA